MEALYTLRDKTITIASYADIIANLASFDKTTWLYQESTGLLIRKEYADGKGTDYTYYDDGKLIPICFQDDCNYISRTWPGR